MRLQKFLADAGIASRRKCEELISDGRVTVNGIVASLGSSVEEGDAVCVDGRRVSVDNERVLIAFNKPRNVICTSAQSEDRVKVTDFFTELPYRLYTVGRLDYDSEGLIFVTNDGELANRLTHPRYGAKKTYRVLASGHFSDEDKHLLRSGVALEDGVTSPAELRILRERQDGRTELLITIHEGKNRQVRRMLSAVGHEVLRLERVAIGKFRLGSLKSGEWRFVGADELELLLK